MLGDVTQTLVCRHVANVRLRAVPGKCLFNKQMRPLHLLDISALNALKIALDGYQRFEGTDSASYFKSLVDALIGPIDEFNIWVIRQHIILEDHRRSKASIVQMRVLDPDLYKRLKTLSPQEIRVLQLVAKGHKAESAMELLGISYRTFNNHKANIVAKMGLGSARELTKFAIDNLDFL